jgi:hypothetical protein
MADRPIAARELRARNSERLRTELRVNLVRAMSLLATENQHPVGASEGQRGAIDQGVKVFISRENDQELRPTPDVAAVDAA